MSDDEQENELWQRQQEEPSLWYARFLLYRDMGPTRSLLGAENLEKVRKSQKKSESNASGAWRGASKQWQWRKRAEAWDSEQQRVALASTMYASVSERVKLLDRWVSTQDAVMVVDVADKGYARADSMEQLRGLLDDIAKETGGRVKVSKKDVNVTSLPKEYVGFNPDQDGIEP